MLFRSVLGGERKTSGLLSKAKIARLEKNEKQGKKGPVDNFMEAVKTKAATEISKMPVTKIGSIAEDLKKADYKKYMNPENLSVYKKIKEVKTSVDQKKDTLQKDIEALKIQERAAEIQKKATGLKGIKVASVADIPAAQRAIQEAASVKADIENLNNDIQKAKKDAESFYAYSTGAFSEIQKAKDADVNTILEKCNIKALNAENLEKALIGPVWLDRLTGVMNFMKLVERYMPPKNKKTLAIKRLHGRDIIFIADPQPGFWIKSISFSSKAPQPDTYAVTGKISDITTEQAITRKPTLLELYVKNGGQSATIKGKLDHINETNDELSFKINGLPGKLFSLDKVEYGNIKLEKSAVNIDAAILNTASEMTIQGALGIYGIVFSAADKEDIVYQAVSTIDAINLKVSAKQEDGGFDMSVSSDILERLKKNLAKLYGKKLEEIKAKVNKEIEAKVNGELENLKKELVDKANNVKKQLSADTSKYNVANKELEGGLAGINKEIQKAQNKGASEVFKGLKGLFK